jgi:hypothetical protein
VRFLNSDIDTYVSIGRPWAMLYFRSSCEYCVNLSSFISVVVDSGWAKRVSSEGTPVEVCSSAADVERTPRGRIVLAVDGSLTGEKEWTLIGRSSHTLLVSTTGND